MDNAPEKEPKTKSEGTKFVPLLEQMMANRAGEMAVTTGEMTVATNQIENILQRSPPGGSKLPTTMQTWTATT
eukprot:8204761-Ditylum_brightwellii.AAC.1